MACQFISSKCPKCGENTFFGRQRVFDKKDGCLFGCDSCGYTDLIKYDEPKYKYIQVSKVDCVSQSSLNGGRKARSNCWKMVKSLRERIKRALTNDNRIILICLDNEGNEKYFLIGKV